MTRTVTLPLGLWHAKILDTFPQKLMLAFYLIVDSGNENTAGLPCTPIRALSTLGCFEEAVLQIAGPLDTLQVTKSIPTSSPDRMEDAWALLTSWFQVLLL